jgi:hypothetical protein
VSAGALQTVQVGEEAFWPAFRVSSYSSALKAFRLPCKLVYRCAPVAQLDRAIASGAIGREFESLRAHQINVPEADDQALLPFNDIMEQKT